MQAAQTRFDDSVGARLSYVPAMHVRHAAQLLALATVVKDSAAHAVQLRSVLVVMGDPT